MPTTAVDLFASNQPGAPLSSSEHYFVVTPDDTNELPYVTRELTVSPAGDVTVTLVDGTTDVLIPSAVWSAQPTHGIRARKVKSTGTAGGLTIFAKA